MTRRRKDAAPAAVPPPLPPAPAGVDGDRLLIAETTKVGDAEVAQVVRKSRRIRSLFSRAGPLQEFIDDCTTFLHMVRDYANRSYREVPFGCVAAIVAALLYVLNPFDLIPDAIPGVGFIDDAAVVSACLRLVGADLRKYRAWRARQEKQSSLRQ